MHIYGRFILTWKIIFTNEAAKDKKKLEKHPLMLKKTKILLNLMQENPFVLPYEKLIGDFSGCYSRRINVQHRLIYQVYKSKKIIKILSMWEHYE